ncbi:MAG: MMPL family transporter [Actinobacteria bacterium]|nr:MMPL family transporter [Actinomycetota bacterium]
MLGVAALALAALGVIGTGVNARLDPTTLNVPGTESSRADQLLREHFGDSAPFAILLEGPPGEVEKQGKELVEALRRGHPGVSTLSPWDRGRVQGLRPTPRRALILADFHVDLKTAVNQTVPEVERQLEEVIRPPVKATQTGFATLSRAIQNESIDAAERGELLAIPFLLIVLLLVFRSPVAAAIPLAFGAVTVIASRGILYFFTGWFDIDAFALTVCTMMGLALGVDYALLMVSRFREELAAGAEPYAAARRTRRTAGRTTMFAGSTLVLSMLVSLFILPGSLLVSLAGTLAMVVALSVAVATIVGPAILTLLGPNVDRWRFGPIPDESSGLMAFVNGALRRPALAAAVIGAVLLALAAPTLGLKTGPPSPEQLAKDAPARKDAELIDDVIGPGWDAPFQIVAATEAGPITTEKDLAALERFQKRLASLPGVQLVIGPAKIAKRAEPLRNLGNAVLTTEGNIGPVKELGKLGRELGVAAGGVAELRGGISEASDGAGLLALGAGRAAEGAQLIAAGLGRATEGSGRAISALERFAEGARKLEEAELRAAVGAAELKASILSVGGQTLRSFGLDHARAVEKGLEKEIDETLPRLQAPAAVAEEKLKAGLAALEAMTVGKADPSYVAALEAVQQASAAVSGTDPVTGAPYAEGYAGLPTELTAMGERLSADLAAAEESTATYESTINTLAKIRDGAAKLQEALYRIHKYGNRLAFGAEKLSKEAQRLSGGIDQLSGGMLALVGGLKRLEGGAEALEAGLAEGSEEAAPLESGLRDASVQVLAGKAKVRRQARKVRREAPGVFNSGYFVLSALDGAKPSTREAASQTIDVGNGGQAASMLLISDYSFNTPGSIRLNRLLNAEAQAFGQNVGLRTGVAGGAAQLNDYSSITRDRMPLVIAAITLVTFLALILILRAIPLAAIAVGLNLLTVGVAFGILTLLTDLPSSFPLGGHSYVEAVGATMIFGIVFGLSIDYAVFLLTRMREHHDRDGDNAAAVRFGLEKTARVITGAAAIMLAVFVVFSGASIATVSQLGVGLTVAVFLDATVVRIVLLPALMLLLGDRVWWLPKPLQRALPRLRV